MIILKPSKKDDSPTLLDELAAQDVSRRKFLRFSGFIGASAVVLGGVGLAGCGKDDDGTTDDVNLGSGDTGVLNYAYALEQLEAAFYTQAVASPYSGITTREQSFLTNLRNIEVTHREFFRTILGSNAIKDLQVDFSSVNFASRDSVLGTAKMFEDLGVAAYNGAGKLLTSADNLTVAGKIVSVEARNAGILRDLISNGSFADLSTLTALGADVATARDAALDPPQVLAMASTYIKTRLNASNLPTS